MITRPSSQGQVADITQSLNVQQISQTYVALLTQDSIMSDVFQRAGDLGEKVTVSEVSNTQLIDIRVQGSDPAHAATIADTMVQVLIEQNELTQTGRYASIEENINNQIKKIESTISQQQDVLSAEYVRVYQEQLSDLEKKITTSKKEITSLQSAISTLTNQSAASPLTTEQQASLIEKQDLLNNQRSLLATYQNVYNNLLAAGKSQTGNEKTAQMEKALNLYQQIYINLLSNRENVQLARLQNTPNVVQLNPARVGSVPVLPRTQRNTLLGGLAGFVMVLIIIFAREFLDDAINNREDVERVLNLPVLGYIAEMESTEEETNHIYITQQPRSPIAEAFRLLRTNLEFSGAGKPLQVLLVSSAGPGEGKSTVACNLAAVLAQSGKHVVLVDADLRRPSIHKHLGISNRLGLSNLFRNEGLSFQDVSQAIPDTSLSVITSGALPPNPAELLGSEKMLHILDELKKQADYVVIDSPPSLVTDAQLLAAHADGILVVLRPGKTSGESIHTAVEQYQRVGGHILGVVFNRISHRQGYYTSNQYYDKSYYGVSETGQTKKSSRSLFSSREKSANHSKHD